ncbi:MAG: DUF1289 domain-containing protein [Cycloclasticus sp.]|nr:MAG: DUF1289 domain-containing protein [Cycloclasticus sp.]
MESPCIRMCTLNEQDICLGCGRLLKEITFWTTYTDEQRKRLLKLCDERKQDLLTRSS